MRQAFNQKLLDLIKQDQSLRVEQNEDVSESSQKSSDPKQRNV